MTGTHREPWGRALTKKEVESLDAMARACERCDAWLGRLLQTGVIRLPDERREATVEAAP